MHQGSYSIQKVKDIMEAVIFDMDGVLIDSEGIYLEYLLEFAKEKNPAVTMEQLYPMVGATKQDAWEVLEKAVHNGQSWNVLKEEFRQLDIYREIDYRDIFRPEVTEVLKILKLQGYHLAVASSTHLDLVRRILTENEIWDFFEIVVSGSQFKKSKPDPEIYHYTAARLGVREENCLVVEDSTVGILAAHRAGMKIAAMRDKRYNFDQSLADYFIDKIIDVLKILKIA